MKMSIKKITMLGVLVSVAMLFSYVESLVPVFVSVPGIRLGLANIVVLLVMLMFGYKEAFLVGALRVTLSALLFGNLFSFGLSSFGFVLSFFGMMILLRTKRFSVPGISMAGGVLHNLAQLLGAFIILKSMGILVYAFPLGLVGMCTGIINGFICKMIFERTGKHDWIS